MPQREGKGAARGSRSEIIHRADGSPAGRGIAGDAEAGAGVGHLRVVDGIKAGRAVLVDACIGAAPRDLTHGHGDGSEIEAHEGVERVPDPGVVVPVSAVADVGDLMDANPSPSDFIQPKRRGGAEGTVIPRAETAADLVERELRRSGQRGKEQGGGEQRDGSHGWRFQNFGDTAVKHRRL